MIASSGAPKRSSSEVRVRIASGQYGVFVLFRDLQRGSSRLLRRARSEEGDGLPVARLRIEGEARLRVEFECSGELLVAHLRFSEAREDTDPFRFRRSISATCFRQYRGDLVLILCEGGERFPVGLDLVEGIVGRVGAAARQP